MVSFFSLIVLIVNTPDNNLKVQLVKSESPQFLKDLTLIV